MMNKNITATELIEKIVASGHKPQAYSGRMMFKHKCVAMIFVEGDDDHGIPRGNLVDSHADDQVWYWPNVAWPQDAIDYGDKE